MRFRRRLLPVAICAAIGASGAAAARSSPPPPTPAPTEPQPAPGCAVTARRTERLDAVEPRGDLVFASGLRGRLAGIRWPDGPDAEAARARLLAYRGAALDLALHDGPDRWGRVALDAATEGGTDLPPDLAAGLVAAGLAQADAGEDESLCRPALLRIEAAARAAGGGLWVGRPMLGAQDATALAAAQGRFVVAEGRVRSVGERKSRTYLNFAARDAHGLTVTMTRRTWRRMAELGIAAAGLRGRTVRVRGVLETRNGPTIEIAAPEVLEVLDEERAPRR